jgi:L-arabinose transport system substrate-binding protein
MTRPRARHGVIALAMIVAVAACSSGKESVQQGSTGKKVTGPLTIAFLQKQGDQQYFVDEAAGAQAKAKQLGNVTVRVVNLGNDANKTVSETQAAIAQQVNGVIVVVPDPAVGPQLAQLAQGRQVELLAADDQICRNNPKPDSCEKSQLIPRVGFSGTQMGTEVGKRAGELFKQAGWNPAETRIAAAWDQDVTVCTDRVEAAQKAFETAAGQSVEVIKVGTDNTPPDAQSKMRATITANRSVKNWVLWGCNDENVSGQVTAVQNAGYSPDNIIGVGLGAYLACKDWRSGKKTGMKAALFINGYDVGQLAVQTMVDKLRDGKAMPPEAFAPTKMVDDKTWQQAGVKCT